MKPMERLSLIVDRLESLVARMENQPSLNPSPREIHFRRTLEETIRTLEATKQAFHSKQLKQLRERVEAVLNEK